MSYLSDTGSPAVLKDPSNRGRQVVDIRKTKMKQDLFTHLSSEIVTEIFTRVPAQSILSCKCVCKSWHDLVSTHEFAKLHLSRAVPGLATIVEVNSLDKIIEHTTYDLYLSTITKLNFTHPVFAWIQGSVDGLLLLLRGGFQLHLCNPITREAIDLLHSRPFYSSKLKSNTLYGFGVSKITGQYKAISIFPDQTGMHECEVYTIGTGSWRSVASHAQVTYDNICRGEFVNGSLHWLVLNNLKDALCISCFDLETELFTTFSPLPLQNKTTSNVCLSTMEDNLCLCDYTSEENMVIWSMKDKTWIKEFVIETVPEFYPVKISQVGVILRTHPTNSLFYYSNKNKTTQRICNFDKGEYINARSHTPSLLSLKCFEMENIISL